MRKDDPQAFDAWMRENLRSLPVPPAPAFHLREPGRPRVRMMAWISAAAVCASVAAMVLLSPPPLVGDAWEHVAEETGLRGDFVADAAQINASLGLAAKQSLPGYVQLAKRCQVGGHSVYHVTTFIDGKGWVTILSFPPGTDVAGTQSQGQWMGRHWALLTVQTKHTVLLLSDNNDALKDVKRYLST